MRKFIINSCVLFIVCVLFVRCERHACPAIVKNKVMVVKSVKGWGKRSSYVVFTDGSVLITHYYSYEKALKRFRTGDTVVMDWREGKYPNFKMDNIKNYTNEENNF